MVAVPWDGDTYVHYTHTHTHVSRKESQSRIMVSVINQSKKKGRNEEKSHEIVFFDAGEMFLIIFFLSSRFSVVYVLFVCQFVHFSYIMYTRWEDKQINERTESRNTLYQKQQKYHIKSMAGRQATHPEKRNIIHPKYRRTYKMIYRRKKNI